MSRSWWGEGVGGNVFEYAGRILSGDDRIVKAEVLALVFVDAGVTQAGVFIAFKLVNRAIHQGAVEQPQADQQLEVGHGSVPSPS